MTAPYGPPPPMGSPVPPPRQARSNRLLYAIGVLAMVALTIIGVTALVLAFRTGDSDADNTGGSTQAGEQGNGQSAEKDKGGGSDGGAKTPLNTAMGEGVVIGGRSDAKVVVELFEDFSCPHCAAFEQAGATETLNQYVRAQQIRIVFYPATLSSFEQGGYGNDKAANAWLCVRDMGNDHAYSDELFARQKAVQGKWTPDELLNLNSSPKANPEFQKCLKNMPYADYLKSIDKTMAKKNVTGTPTVLVNGKPVTLTGLPDSQVQAMKNAIDAALRSTK